MPSTQPISSASSSAATTTTTTTSSSSPTSKKPKQATKSVATTAKASSTSQPNKTTAAATATASKPNNKTVTTTSATANNSAVAASTQAKKTTTSAATSSANKAPVAASSQPNSTTVTASTTTPTIITTPTIADYHSLWYEICRIVPHPNNTQTKSNKNNSSNNNDNKNNNNDKKNPDEHAINNGVRKSVLVEIIVKTTTFPNLKLKQIRSSCLEYFISIAKFLESFNPSTSVVNVRFSQVGIKQIVSSPTEAPKYTFMKEMRDQYLDIVKNVIPKTTEGILASSVGTYVKQYTSSKGPPHLQHKETRQQCFQHCVKHKFLELFKFKSSQNSEAEYVRFPAVDPPSSSTENNTNNNDDINIKKDISPVEIKPKPASASASSSTVIEMPLPSSSTAKTAPTPAPTPEVVIDEDLAVDFWMTIRELFRPKRVIISNPDNNNDEIDINTEYDELEVEVIRQYLAKFDSFNSWNENLFKRYCQFFFTKGLANQRKVKVEDKESDSTPTTSNPTTTTKQLFTLVGSGKKLENWARLVQLFLPPNNLVDDDSSNDDDDDVPQQHQEQPPAFKSAACRNLFKMRLRSLLAGEKKFSENDNGVLPLVTEGMLDLCSPLTMSQETLREYERQVFALQQPTIRQQQQKEQQHQEQQQITHASERTEEAETNSPSSSDDDNDNDADQIKEQREIQHLRRLETELENQSMKFDENHRVNNNNNNNYRPKRSRELEWIGLHYTRIFQETKLVAKIQDETEALLNENEQLDEEIEEMKRKIAKVQDAKDTLKNKTEEEEGEYEAKILQSLCSVKWSPTLNSFDFHEFPYLLPESLFGYCLLGVPMMNRTSALLNNNRVKMEFETGGMAFFLSSRYRCDDVKDSQVVSFFRRDYSPQRQGAIVSNEETYPLLRQFENHVQKLKMSHDENKNHRVRFDRRDIDEEGRLISSSSSSSVFSPAQLMMLNTIRRIIQIRQGEGGQLQGRPLPKFPPHFLYAWKVENVKKGYERRVPAFLFNIDAAVWYAKRFSEAVTFSVVDDTSKNKNNNNNDENSNNNSTSEKTKYFAVSYCCIVYESIIPCLTEEQFDDVTYSSKYEPCDVVAACFNKKFGFVGEKENMEQLSQHVDHIWFNVKDRAVQTLKLFSMQIGVDGMSS